MSSAFILPPFLISKPKVDPVCLVSRKLKDLSNTACRNILVNKVMVMKREEN